MAANVSGQTLINESQKRADVEGATDRHPRADILIYVNNGARELYDLLIEARGASYYRSSSPWSFTTTADTTSYTGSFPAAFYRLISIRVSDGTVSEGLLPFSPSEEPGLRATDVAAYFPTHYELRPSGVALLPEHAAGKTVTVEYVPAMTDLTDASNSYFDSINGWTEYVVAYAARLIAIKDEEFELARVLEGEMGRLKERIKKLAPNRDAYRARRIQDVRGARMGSGTRGRGWR